MEEEGLKLPDYVKHVIETLELNSLDAFQELDASHTQKIKSIIMKQKKNFGPEIQKTLFEIKNKIRTQKNQLFSALRLKLKNQSETDEVFLIEDTEIEMPNESTQMITDSSLDQTVEQKSLDPEFLERMEDENFCDQIITKLDNNLKQYIYKFTDVEKIEKSTLVINKGKLQGRSKCPECGGVFVVQANVRRLNVKWIPSNMRKHYNRHFKIMLKEEGQDSETIVKNENTNEFTVAGHEFSTPDEKVSVKKPRKMQIKEKSPKKLVKKEKSRRLVKIIMPRIKEETVTPDFEEIQDSVPESHDQYEEIMAEQSMEVLDEEHYNPDEGQEEDHEIFQQMEDQGDGEHYFDEEILEEEEELEAPEPQEPIQKKMKREPLDYSEIVDEPESSELVFNQPQTSKKKSFHSIDEDDPDWLYCKTICAMMKTMPLDMRNQLKIEILTMTTRKQHEMMSK